jgi:hypothetical protein
VAITRLDRQRSDDVVGLDAADLDDRPAQRLGGLVDGRDLGCQFPRHRGAMRLVFGKYVVPKGLTLGIEYAGAVVARHGGAQCA